MENTPNPERAPRRFFSNRLFTWRNFRRGLIGLAVLITLFAIALTEENWRGRRAWEKYKSELEAKGEKLDFKDFIPPPVPDDKNFAMTPFLAPLFDFNSPPLKENQSIHRDTNGVNRVSAFQEKFQHLPNSLAFIWNPGKIPGLVDWALAFQEENVPPGERKRLADQRRAQAAQGTNASPVEDKEVMTRAGAAAIVMRVLEKDQPIMDEINAARKRPYARFGVNYDEPLVAAILLPHLSALKSLGLSFGLRACAELALDQGDRAFADTQLTMYLANTMKNEPFVISHLVRLAMLEFSIRPVWEGLAAHEWNDAQLEALSRDFGKLDFVADLAGSLRGDLAGDLLLVDQLRGQARSQHPSFGDIGPATGTELMAKFIPGGWFNQNKLAIARLYEEGVLPAVDGPNRRIYPAKDRADEAMMEKEFSGFSFYKVLAKLLRPPIGSMLPKFAHAQSMASETQIACALERYRLARGEFPETLDALVPRYLEKVPLDVITGEPLKYRRGEPGRFLLYSVGWDERDDGGKTVEKTGKTSNQALTEGDWVWPKYPEK